MAMSAELRSRLVECVRAFQAEQGQRCGADKTFQEIEDEACEFGDAVAQTLMAESLAEQATQAPQELWACCPRCQRPAKEEAEPEPRVLDTRRGVIGWREPKHYCHHCRQSFFPSIPRLGN